MIIDTRKRVISIQLRRMVSVLVFAIAIIIILLVGKLPNTVLGLNKYHWAVLVAGLYISSVVFESLLQYNYVYFNDETDKIIFRYFTLGYMSNVKKSIEIPKSELVSYQLYEYVKGYKKKIVLHQKRNQTDAKYPPVCLSILKEDELKMILESLDKIKQF